MSASVTLETLPPAAELAALIDAVPADMHPCMSPYAVVLPGHLTADQIRALRAAGGRQEAYRHALCGALTREYRSSARALALLDQLARRVNELAWQYDVDPGCRAWLQTYGRGDDYQLHMDAVPGASRKLTAVALLSPLDDYDGGDLVIRAVPGVHEYTVPRAPGTVVVFQPWLLHEVTPVTRGRRQTVNLGIWGPPLR